LKQSLEGISQGLNDSNQTDAAMRQNRPEVHFTGPSLLSTLSPIDLVRDVKSESDVPEFLRLKEDVGKDLRQIEIEEESLATTCMFTEITLKN